jgi:hypothetical protein
MRQRTVLSDDEWKHFLRGWGGVDGKAALDFLEASPEDSAAVSSGDHVAALTGWASRDVAGAQAWLADHVTRDHHALRHHALRHRAPGLNTRGAPRLGDGRFLFCARSGIFRLRSPAARNLEKVLLRCRFSRQSCACVFVMKKHLITLIVAASAVVHTHAADLASQLVGYWKPDMEKTLGLAKKANRELDPMTQALMGKMVFEFQKESMTVHGPPGFTSDDPAVPFKVKGVDKATNSLTLSAGGEEMKVKFDKGQIALNDPEKGWMIFNRMSKKDFAKRDAAAILV